jgi:anti-sigma factor RsiW
MSSDGQSTAIEERVRGLTCRQVVELIASYLEGALDEPERARVARHLAACGNCLTYLEQMRLTAVWLSRLSSDEVTPEIKHDLLERFRRWCAEQS